MKRLLFAANWKMHLGPTQARAFLSTFLGAYHSLSDREVWFFPPAISLTTVTGMLADRPDLAAGVQNVYWEPDGAFTGELSVGMVKEAGAVAALVGHSERRHVFGETDEGTGRKARALLDNGLTPVFCVGEKLAERESGATERVVERQLDALAGLPPEPLRRVTVAYEPVWAIGTGRNASPQDAAAVHRVIRRWFTRRGVAADHIRVLYGGSVKRENVAELVAEDDIDGVLVGGASLDPNTWATIAATRV